MSRLPGATQPFAWCGIALDIPMAWDTGMLGQGYALLEDPLRPVMELKTALVRGRFSVQRHLKKLARSGRNGGVPSLIPIPMPSGWPTFPPPAEVSAFRWQGVRVGGQGLVHSCRTSNRVTLIQFYDHGDGVSPSAPQILKTLRDYQPGTGPSLAVYDIYATLPERFALGKFQFEAGRFTLDFNCSEEKVTLLRWSPADVILAECGGDLAQLAGKMDLLPPPAVVENVQPGRDAVQWQWPGKAIRKGLATLWRRSAGDTVSALRIWHRLRANRILAVQGEALADGATFERICHDYGIIQA